MKKISGRILSLLLLPGLIAAISSCDTETTTKPSSTGQSSEIVVVSENNLWKSSAGDTIRDFFDGPFPGMPQPEPLYKLIQVKVDGFGKLLQNHRNIFIIAIDSSLTAPKIEIRRNVWARPQRVVKISSPTIEGIKEQFIERREEILNLFDNAEIEKIQELYRKNFNIDAIKAIRNKFGLDLNVPKDYYLAVDTNNFIWLRRETNVMSQGILIYAYPYTDTLAFNANKIRSIRNQFTQLYVPGPSEGSFMIVAEDVMPPAARTITLKDMRSTEMRGLWEVRKDFMGGPFLNYTFVDVKNNMVIGLDGYVYAPNQSKRNYLKQVQAVLLSFDILEN